MALILFHNLESEAILFLMLVTLFSFLSFEHVFTDFFSFCCLLSFLEVLVPRKENALETLFFSRTPICQ